MICHPDKLQNEKLFDSDKIYIANRCFAALNTAYNAYKS